MTKAEQDDIQLVMADELLACHECDLVHRVVHMDGAHVGRCTRCGAVLYKGRSNALEICLALCVTGVLLFMLSNAFPLLTFELEGRSETNTLMSGVLEFWHIGHWDLSILVFVTAIFFPCLYLLSNLYVLLPLYLGRRIQHLERVFRLSLALKPWAMMEVFLLGLFVGFVKLMDLADISAGVALYCFCALILVNAGIAAMLDPREIWLHPEVNT